MRRRHSFQSESFRRRYGKRAEDMRAIQWPQPKSGSAEVQGAGCDANSNEATSLAIAAGASRLLQSPRTRGIR